jgi:hypothetical protein
MGFSPLIKYKPKMLAHNKYSFFFSFVPQNGEFLENDLRE